MVKFHPDRQMKSATHPFHQRNPLGLYYEKILKPALERSMGEELVKTAEDTDTMDFVGKTCFVELKTRGDQYHYSQSFIQKDGWLLPSCKIQRAVDETKRGKKVVFFYFWRAGKSLWRWDFKLDDIKDIDQKYPVWHIDQQKQAYVKEDKWVRIY